MTTQPDSAQTTSTMPACFVGVGSPRSMFEPEWNAGMKAWAETMERPKAILLFSAHWLNFPTTLGATEPVPLVYDYYNFPRHFYEVKYENPPAPELAERFIELMDGRLDIERSDRGLDHGAFVGLKAMYPEANIPVLEVSIPTFHPESLFNIGRVLAPLRDEGVMVMGCGLLTHSGESPEANRAFDAWVVEKLGQRDYESLFQYRETAPGVMQALPTVEHFVPLFVAAGAAYESNGDLLSVGGLSQTGGSRRSFQFN